MLAYSYMLENKEQNGPCGDNKFDKALAFLVEELGLKPSPT